MRIVLALFCMVVLSLGAFAQDASVQNVGNNGHESPAVLVGDTVTAVPIATARQDSSNLKAWYLNDTLKLAGVITTTNLQTGKTAYCIQDTSAGIYLYCATAKPFSIGDSVSVIGQIQQYHGLTEIVPWDTAHITLIKSNVAVPKPIHLTLHQFNSVAESYESMLVEVDTLYRWSGYWPAATKSSSIYMKDTVKTPTSDLIQQNVLLPPQRYPSSDSIQMYLTSASNIPGSADSLVGYPINLVGVVSQYSSGSTVNSGYELEPRYSADIQSTLLIPFLTIAQARVENNWVPVHSVTNDTFAVRGVVTSVNLGATSATPYSSYFIQDTTGGIDVYSSTLMNFAVGDSVLVIGSVDQYNGLEEIVPLVGDSLHFGLLKHGAAIPQPKHLTLSNFAIPQTAEIYEGQLIELDTVYKSSGTWPAAGSSASIYATDSAKTATVQLYINKNTDVPGTKEHLYPVNVVGVVSQYGTDSTGYEVIPMDTTDIWKTPGVPSLVTIAQARVDANSDLIPDHKVTGDTLMIYGVVTSPNMGSTYTSYYIQDATAGIDVYKGGTVMSFSRGDSVFVIGTVTQSHGLTEISPLAADAAHFGYLKHNAVMPTPKHFTLHQYVLNAESYEGSLIEIDTLYKLKGSWGAGKTDTVTNLAQTDTALIYINSYTNVGSMLEPAYPINLIGIASQYSSGSSVVTGGYEIIPPDSTDITLTPPAAPTVIALAGATNQRADTLVLGWHPSATATKYLFQLSKDKFSTYAVNDSSVVDTTRKVTALTNGTKYFWRVAAYNAGGFSAFSTVDSFTTIPIVPAAPAVIALAGATNQRADTLALSWHPSATATKYLFQLSEDKFSTYVVNDSNVVDTTRKVTALSNLTKYFWRVAAYNTGGFSAFSTADSFTTIVALPAKPVLVSPIGGKTGVARMTTFVWDSTALATKYELQVASDKAFTTIVRDLTVKDTTVQLSDTLLVSTTYYWRVSAIDTAGATASDTASFTTGIKVGVKELLGIPKEFALFQNYPNPFNPSTVIRYDLPKNSYVRVAIYDILGRVVANLVDGSQSANRYSVTWSPTDLSSGIYFCRIQAQSQDGSSNFTSVKKLLYMK